MAVLDNLLRLSGTMNGNTFTGQTVTGATAVVSTNSIDTQSGSPTQQNADLGKGEPLLAQVNILTTFTGLTALDVQWISADDGALTTNVTVLSSQGAVPVANLVAGRQITIDLGRIEPGTVVRRYIGLRYVPTGTGTAGALSAFVVRNVGDLPQPYTKSGFTIA